MDGHRLRSGMGRTAMLAAATALAALAAFTLSAGADIVKCVDQIGRVTLTDAPCAEGIGSVLALGVAENAVPASSALPAAGLAPLAPQAQPDGSRSPPVTRMLARDVDTLKAARASMQVLDEASATLRHPHVTGIDRAATGTAAPDPVAQRSRRTAPTAPTTP